MNILIVVNNLRDWPLEIPDVTVVPARSYLTDPRYGEERGIRVFNLCKSYRYQSLGYYVSLLAEARGHKPMPRANTMEDLQSLNLVRLLTDGLDEIVQRSLAQIKSETFDLSIYFGRNVAHRYDRLSLELFNLLQAPLLRANFEKSDGQWHMRNLHSISASDIPPHHQDFVIQAALNYFQGRRGRLPKRTKPRYSLAILCDAKGREQASNAKALRNFEKAANKMRLGVEFITSSDFNRLTEFDALFIRATTFVHHYTYYFSRRASAEGLVVIDDPESILKCNNKVYMDELLTLRGIPKPRTLLVHRDNIQQIIPALGLPCVLKKPDSSFSVGVEKVESEGELQQKVSALLENSELVIAQEYLPTEFDWRIGILDRRPLFVAKYFMVPGHWQIIRHEKGTGRYTEGRTVGIALDEAPGELVRLALKAANLFGAGFYGVDVKQVGNQFYVIEVNDNPNVDAGHEDSIIKDELYREVIGVIVRRLDERKWGVSGE